MNLKSRTRSRRAPKTPFVRPLDSPVLDSTELDAPQFDPYIIVSQRPQRGKRVREQPVRVEPELEEMSPMVPLLFLLVPLVLVVIYGALSSWPNF